MSGSIALNWHLVPVYPSAQLQAIVLASEISMAKQAPPFRHWVMSASSSVQAEKSKKCITSEVRKRSVVNRLNISLSSQHEKDDTNDKLFLKIVLRKLSIAFAIKTFYFIY